MRTPRSWPNAAGEGGGRRSPAQRPLQRCCVQQLSGYIGSTADVPASPHVVADVDRQPTPQRQPAKVFMVKVFGCRLAYENRPSTNPRGCVSDLWRFRLLAEGDDGGVGSAMTPRRMRRARLCARRSVESDLAARDVQAFSQVPGERRADGVRRNLAFGPRLRRHVALTGICRPALWPPRVRRQSLCPFSTPRRIHADSDRPQRYRNSPRSLKHARLNKPMTRSSPCEGGPESIGAIWRDIDRMMTALTAASARRLNIASSVCCNAKLIETVQHSVMTH